MTELGLEEPAHTDNASLASRFRVVEMLGYSFFFVGLDSNKIRQNKSALCSLQNAKARITAPHQCALDWL